MKVPVYTYLPNTDRNKNQFQPDGNYLLVTTRTGIIFPDKMNISFTIPNLEPNNKTTMDSDPFVNFRIDHESGNLTRIQEFPAGGMVPRHFSYSNDGTMVAVVLSRDERVMIIDRDVKTGMLMNFKAWVHVDKEPSFVLWKQSKLLVSSPWLSCLVMHPESWPTMHP